MHMIRKGKMQADDVFHDRSRVILFFNDISVLNHIMNLLALPPSSRHNRLEHSTALLIALRSVACCYGEVAERKFFGCPSFQIRQRMMACVCGDRIALKLPRLAVCALLETRGCTLFQPFGRRLMARWLAFEADSPAFASLEDLFEESLSFVSELPAKE